MKYLVRIVLFFFLFINLIFDCLEMNAQTNPCYLYGSITTLEGNVYEGAIRWNDEEVFLTDIFNSEKETNPYLKYLDRNRIEKDGKVKKRDRWAGFEFTGDDYYNGVRSKYDRKFQCRFGDIKSISVTGRESVSLELRSGKFINLKGGSNDVGTRIWILDHELGLLKLDWNKIDVVNFFLPPEKVSANFGEPIYGTLTTTKGEFTGFIQWDHDERLLKDQLDGRSRDGDFSIPFTNIKFIEKRENGVEVSLHSGRKLQLGGKNDVNTDNRGIMVTIPEVGRIDFGWEHFLSLDLLPLVKDQNCASGFPDTQRLYGKVTSKKGKSYEGIIVYDLDEAMDAELLNGFNDKLEFFIPFRNIKVIQPKAYNYCLVELKNGEKLYLGDQTDVSGRNAGILVFVEKDLYHFLEWEEIERIEFK